MTSTIFTQSDGMYKHTIFVPFSETQNETIQRTSSPFLSVLRPDQKRWAQILTALHWSGFFRSLEAASAHWVLSGSWFSSLKHRIRSKVPMIRVMAANWALESLISSSYREKAWYRERINGRDMVGGKGGKEKYNRNIFKNPITMVASVKISKLLLVWIRRPIFNAPALNFHCITYFYELTSQILFCTENLK